MLFGINDIYDHETDKQNPRKGGFLHGAMLSKIEFGPVNKISGVIAAVIILIGAVSQNMVTFSLSIALVATSYAYSVPPLRLKERPPLDSISNAAIIYLIVALGFSYIGQGFLIPEGSFFTLTFPLLIAIIAIHMFSTIMDHTPDKKASVKTMATVFSKTKTAYIALILMAFSLLNIDTSDKFIIGFLGFCIASMCAYFISRKERTAKMVSISQAVVFVICIIGSIV